MPPTSPDKKKMPTPHFEEGIRVEMVPWPLARYPTV